MKKEQIEKKKGRGEVGKEWRRRLSRLPSFSACTFPGSLLRADGPSCLSVFELHPAAEAGNRLAMLSKGEGCSDQCKQAPGDKFLQTNGNLPLDPHQPEVTQRRLLMYVLSKATFSHAWADKERPASPKCALSLLFDLLASRKR